MATAVSTQLSALTGANTIEQMMGDVNSLKTLSALATDAAGSGDFVPTTGGNFTGNVGIGTASPGEKLHIAGGSSTGALIVSESTSTSQYSGGGIALMNGATSNDNHVLINTFIRDSDSSDSVFTINKIDGSRSYSQTLAQYDLSDNYWRFLTNDTERMRIDSSGNVGIGVTDPSQKLEMLGNAVLRATSTESRFFEIGNSRTADGNSYLDFVGDTTYSDYGLRILRFGGANSPTQIKHRGTSTLSLVAEDAGKVTFSTNNTERMRVDADGNIGIGTTSPSEPLEVAGKIKTTSGGIEFPDGTTQTTAASAGITTGKAIAMAIVFG
jgi:hypothetical protein